ncbi:hypothetical protein NDU88_008774 [Pleurodeles waltl]|uniref:Uncharacterized protein n=1 Tax=Pleurodeles waltl TaxID=8319 RepID=A0AAV7QRN2_PLEWA|nr:hypothetical protein NDU88_008774 [Pleurodeles waltl]
MSAPGAAFKQQRGKAELSGLAGHESPALKNMSGSREGAEGEDSVYSTPSSAPWAGAITMGPGAGEASGEGGQGSVLGQLGPRDPRVPISTKWPPMLQWSSSEEEGEQVAEEGGWSGAKNPWLLGPIRPPGVFNGAQARWEKEDMGKTGGGEDYPLGEGGLLEKGVEESFSTPGTPDLLWQDTLDFEEEDPGEQCAAQSPWKEVKVGPGAAGRMTSAGRVDLRLQAAQFVVAVDLGGAAGAVAWHEEESDASLEEAELVNSGSETEWWERGKGQRDTNPVSKSLQVEKQLMGRAGGRRKERAGVEVRTVQERPPLLSPVKESSCFMVSVVSEGREDSVCLV